jgi:cytoskeletal protein RodZ
MLGNSQTVFFRLLKKSHI